VHYYDDWESDGDLNPIKSVFFDGDTTTWLCNTCDTPENRQEIYDAHAKKTYEPAYTCTYCTGKNELELHCKVCKEEYYKRIEAQKK
jgi:hypothetical protein